MVMIRSGAAAGRNPCSCNNDGLALRRQLDGGGTPGEAGADDGMVRGIK